MNKIIKLKKGLSRKMCHCTKEGKQPLFLRKSPKPEKSSSGSNHPQHGWYVLRQVKKEEVSTRLTSVECISFYNVVELGANSFFQETLKC